MFQEVGVNMHLLASLIAGQPICKRGKQSVYTVRDIKNSKHLPDEPENATYIGSQL
jgi:hypothetical protein